MAIDASIAKIRDQVKSSTDLKVVSDGITRYADTLAAVDMSDVPGDVKDAYVKHIAAWRATSLFLTRYTGVSGSFLRGLDGDNYVKSQLEVLDGSITSTWAEVKAKAAVYGVKVPD